MDTFGEFFKVTIFGESHGPAIGVVIDGVPENIPLDELMRTWMAKLSPADGQPAADNRLGCFFISAARRTNIDELRELLYKRVRELHVQKYPYNDFLYDHYDTTE